MEDSSQASTATSTAEEKGQTFRKRRLSLTSLKQQQQQQQQPLPKDGQDGDGTAATETEAASARHRPDGNKDGGQDSTADQNSVSTSGGPDDEKAQTFRKRRLSLTHKREDPASVASAESNVDRSTEAVEPSPQRRRRLSDVSVTSARSDAGFSSRPLKSRIVHASELLAHPPSSPAGDSMLYQASAPPQQQPLLGIVDENSPTPLPKWKKRHTRNINEDERKLPFPRHIVGTFSCHGVEPLYDSDDGAVQDDDFDDDDDDDWNVPFAISGVTVGSDSAAKLTSGQTGSPDGDSLANNKEQPTMAAKINQDRGGVAFPYGNCARTALFAVYDGHGKGGESVAQFALHEVQRRLEKHQDFTKDIENAFKQTFVGVDESLENEVLIEPMYSGTTACVVLLREDTLIVSNAGDSRAVLARAVPGGDDTTASDSAQQVLRYEAINLSTDQNPDLPEEQARIERMGGFVSPPPEPGLSARVWLDSDYTQIGLAMARSIGDHAVKSIGVIAEPVVTQHKIDPNDEFMILATDGVWEFLSSAEAVRIVSEHLDKGATRACQSLIEAAAARWHDEEGNYRDDITALVVRLKHLWDAEEKKGTGSKSGTARSTEVVAPKE